MLHRGSLKAEKIRNFSVMRLHSEKAPKTTWFYHFYSINNDLLNKYKILSIFLGFYAFCFMMKSFFVWNLRPSNENTYIVIFLNFFNLIYNNQLLFENHTLASYKWHTDNTTACESDIISIFSWKNFRVSQLVFWGQKISVRKKV